MSCLPERVGGSAWVCFFILVTPRWHALVSKEVESVRYTGKGTVIYIASTHTCHGVDLRPPS